jgi:uncharacterized protein (TIGR02996 family)
MTDQSSLLAAIRACPDDTALLGAYADFLDEQPTVSAPCPACKSVGQKTTRGYIEFSGGFDKVGRCVVCAGTGFVTDTSNRDRAELIRVQCEISQLEKALTEKQND